MLLKKVSYKQTASAYRAHLDNIQYINEKKYLDACKDTFRMLSIREMPIPDQSTITCDHCHKRVYAPGHYWQIRRWWTGETLKDFKVCENCCSTKEKALDLIDSDAINYGVSPWDAQILYRKKDSTLWDEALTEMFKPRLEHSARFKLV